MINVYERLMLNTVGDDVWILLFDFLLFCFLLFFFGGGIVVFPCGVALFFLVDVVFSGWGMDFAVGWI